MVLAFRKLTAQAPFTLAFSSPIGVRQGHFSPWCFIPCAYEVSVTRHLPEKPQERTGPKSFSAQGSTSQKAAQTVYFGERKLLLPAGAAPALCIRPADTELDSFPIFLVRDRGLCSGLGSLGCQVRPAFWKSRPEGIVKGPIWGERVTGSQRPLSGGAPPL